MMNVYRVQLEDSDELFVVERTAQHALNLLAHVILEQEDAETLMEAKEALVAVNYVGPVAAVYGLNKIKGDDPFAAPHNRTATR